MNDQPSESLALDSQLCFKLYAASRAVIRGYKPMLDQLGLTYPQYLVMLVLWQKDDVTVSEIGEQLFLDSATLTPLLKRLESAGLINRQRTRQDERQVAVTLTEAGRALRVKAEAIPEAVKCATACDDDALLALKLQLDGLRDNLNQSR